MARGQRSKSRKKKAPAKAAKTRVSGALAGLRDRIVRVLAIAIVVILAFPLLLILIYRFIDPPFSFHMLRMDLAGKIVRNDWVPLERISPHLIKAVVLSEDARFCSHWGVDWKSMEKAIEKAEKRGGGPRGASTIPMQTAKNLFLWQTRSYVRKAIEIPLAYIMSGFWPKRRMLEIYLNIAEWAPGIFGAEAASRYHFGKGAIEIDQRQAAQMAAALPNPYKRNAGKPGPKTRRLVRKIERRMVREKAELDCIHD